VKLLLSAIACDPLGGSEGIYGWYVVNALAREHECHVITELGYRNNIESAILAGMVPHSVHFRYISTGTTYHPIRLIARVQSWNRYQKFQQSLLSVAEAWHREVNFDLAQHVTYTSWRVPSPLLKLGLPFVWGPLSGTEIFPGSCLGSLSLQSRFFEMARSIQTRLALRNPRIQECARRAALIPVPHRQAAEFMAKLRGSYSGVELCHNFFFPDQRIAALKPTRKTMETNRPLRAFAAGNLEGRKGVAIALEAIAVAKKRGVRVEYRVTSRGPELEHLKRLARRLQISDQVVLGERFESEDFAAALGTFDLCLLPSLRDGAGLSIMEAMLAGCVPIVADWCGPAEFVTEECGFKVPVTNPGDMASRIADILCKLHGNRELIRSLGDAARERIKSAYNERQFLDSMNRYYSEAITVAR